MNLQSPPDRMPVSAADVGAGSGAPAGPVGPVTPVAPGRPVTPVAPATPGRPGRPVGPGGSVDCRGALPVDLGTIRESVDALLGQDVSLPRYRDVEEYILLLRGHLMLLIPEIEDRARLLPGDDAIRCRALAGVDEARRKLCGTPGPGLVSAVRHAQHLARSCRALVLHYERLAGAAPAADEVAR